MRDNSRVCMLQTHRKRKGLHQVVSVVLKHAYAAHLAHAANST